MDQSPAMHNWVRETSVLGGLHVRTHTHGIRCVGISSASPFGHANSY
jgi:hypothetical protein